jgi:hypothetical protein
MTNQYLFAIGLSLFVAAYMFAAIRFPALRWIFRLKRRVARLTGTSDEQNRNFGDTLGLVLCPICGLIAIGFAVHFSLEWNETATRERERVVALEKAAKSVSETLSDGKIGSVNFGEPNLQRVASEAGQAQIEKVLRELAPAITPAALVTRPEPNRRDQLLIEWKPQDSAAAAIQLKAAPTEGYLFIPTEQGARAIHVPAALRDSFAALARVEQIDLLALQRKEEQKKAAEKAAEDRRLSNYIEVAHQGPASWQILEAVAAEPLENQPAKSTEYVGVPIDWELEVSSIKEEGDQMRVTAHQSNPRKPVGNEPVRSPGIQFLVAKHQVADLKVVPSRTWLRVAGKVESVPLRKPTVIEKTSLTIYLQVDRLVAFQP